MGCASSKYLENGSSVYQNRPTQQQYQQQQQQQIPFNLPQNLIPPSTLPPGWISQFDPNKQRLYYIYPQTRQVTWVHPNGEAADAQEMARFYQIQEIQRQQYGQRPYYESSNVSRPYADSYNRMGGGAAGFLAGDLLGHHGGFGGYGGYGYGGYDDGVFPADVGYGGGDVFPADVGYADGGNAFTADFGGGGDFGGGDFGGGDFGGGF
ncbi:hypothetical protein BGZ49_001343 [Haplosporangium sp. Z 27]|nr:hypothetical protein BGZ49_001343 [Haplosporangium sp. Z 27]